MTNFKNKRIDKTSFIPVYYQLLKILEETIQSGMMPGDALPPEQEIARHFGISRMTVRRAIAELVQAGMVYAEKGKGTFVAKPKLDNLRFELDDFYNEMQQKGINSESKLLEVRIVKSDKNIHRKSGIPVDVRCLFYRIIRMAGTEPLIYETKYIVYSKRKPLLEAELLNSSLSSLLSSNGSLPVKSKKILQVHVLREQEAKLLNVKTGTPAFLMEQILYDVDNKPLAWGVSLYRGDRYKITSYSGWTSEELLKDGGFSNGQRTH